MSSYLSIYLQPKGGAKLDLCSYSRNTNLYDTFRDAGVAYYGNEAEPHYTALTTKFLNDAIKDVEQDIKKAQHRKDMLERYANGNTDVISEIMSWEEHIADLNEVMSELLFLYHVAQETENGSNSFEGLYANID